MQIEITLSGRVFHFEYLKNNRGDAPGGYLVTDQSLSDDEKLELTEYWEKLYAA
jgi:hypothetical protein